MAIIKSNFEFIQTDFPDLYELGATAETLYSIDAESCIAKIRVFAEYWLKLFFEQQGIKYKPMATLSDLLLQADRHRILPEHVSDLLNKIRLQGNVASHANISSISGRKQSVDIHKNALKTMLKDIFSLAEFTIKQANPQADVPQWEEPEDLADIKHYKDAFHGEPDALFRIVSEKFNQIGALPKDTKLHTRQEAKRLFGEFQMWKERCIAVSRYDVYAFEYFIYTGTLHPSLKDAQKLKPTEKLVKQYVDEATFHYMKACYLDAQMKFAEAAKHYRLAYDLGNESCFDELISNYYFSDYDAYLEMIEIGVEKNIYNAKVLYALYLMAEKDETYSKEIKKLINYCRSQNSKVGDYLNALYECFTHTIENEAIENFNPDFGTIASGWELVPEISHGTSLSVFYLTHYDREALVSKDLLELALGVSKRNLVYPHVLFSAFHVVVHHQENNNPKFGHMSAASLIHKSAELGYEPAKEMLSRHEYRKQFQLKGKRGKPNRKAVKARRKQKRK